MWSVHQTLARHCVRVLEEFWTRTEQWNICKSLNTGCALDFILEHIRTKQGAKMIRMS